MMHYSVAHTEEKKDAILAFGTLVKVESDIFLDIISKSEDSLVVMAEEKSYFSKVMYKYM